MNVTTVMKLLPAIGPVIAALPEFKALFSEIVATFAVRDQDELKRAYAMALDRANEAHDDLQALVSKYD